MLLKNLQCSRQTTLFSLFCLDPDWKIVWNERLKPHLDEFQVDGKAVGVPGFVKLLESDGETALYNEYFSVV